MPDQNKDIVRHICDEIWNQGNFSIIDERFASDYLEHACAEVKGIDSGKHFAVAMRSAFSDIQFTVEDEIAEGDRVVHRWTAQGTQIGEFQGIPPTGEQVTITGISVYRVADGKMVECWTNAGMLKMEKNNKENF